MADYSGISWLFGGSSWNPVTGCFMHGRDCAGCYAQPLSHHLGNVRHFAKYQGITHLVHGRPLFNGEVNLGGPDLLNLPRKWRRARVIFVTSMSDLFFEKVPLSFILAVFRVMVACPHHLFIILTKRAERLAELAPSLPWPPNVWIGVSVGHSDYLNRLDFLRRVPTENRLLSAEPLLDGLPGLDLTGIAWVLLGGESGPNYREAKVADIRAVRDQTLEQGKCLFFKQWGGPHPNSHGNSLDGRKWLDAPFDLSPYRRRTEEKVMVENEDPDDEPETEDDETGEQDNAGDVTDSEQSARRTSERYDNEPAPKPPLTRAALLQRGLRNKRKREGNDWDNFLIDMDQAQVLCIARDDPPEGLGYKGDAYARFSADIGFPGKSGKTLPRLFKPYAKRATDYVLGEKEAAEARGETFEYDGWRKLLEVMAKKYEAPKQKRGKNSQGADEELNEDGTPEPEEVQAELREEIRKRDAKLAAIEAKAKDDAAIFNQRLKSEQGQREEVEEKHQKAQARVAELEAENARLRALVENHQPPPAPDGGGVAAATVTDPPDEPAPTATPSSDAARALAEALARSAKAVAERRSEPHPEPEPEPAPVNPPLLLAPPVIATDPPEPAIPPPGTVTDLLGPLPPVTSTRGTRRGRSREPVTSEAKLKQVIARALKALTLEERDLTCATVLSKIQPVWDSIRQAEFQGDFVAIWRAYMVRRLWASADSSLGGLAVHGRAADETLAWYGVADPTNVLAWSVARGFAIRSVGHDPDDDGSGKPNGHAAPTHETPDGDPDPSPKDDDPSDDDPPEGAAQSVAMMDRPTTWSRATFQREMKTSDMARKLALRQLFVDLTANVADVSPRNQFRRVWIEWLDEHIADLEPEQND